MPAPRITLDEAECLDALKTFVLTCVPDVASVDVYRARPAAVPSKWGLSVVLTPTTPLPIFASPMGEESTAAQRQRVRVVFKKAVAGTWALRLFGEDAVVGAGGNATTANLRDGFLAEVADLGLPLTTASVPAGNAAWSAFEVTADVAGASMGAQLTVPAGGQATLEVVDDNASIASYNWGTWTIRLVVRDVDNAGGTGGSRVGPYVEMLRLRMQAQSVPLTAGLAYPYQRDLLQEANLCWRQTLGPFSADVVEGNVWHRGMALDFVFDVSSALVVDVPSLDTMVLQGAALA